MKNLLKISGLLLIVFFSSCDEDFFQSTVELEIPEHVSTLAVTGTLTQGTDRARILVTNSRSINDVSPPEVLNGAEVRLFKDENLMPAFTDNNGYHEILFDPSELTSGSSFRLEVEHPNFETVTATQLMPNLVALDTFEFTKEGTVDEIGEPVDEIVIEFADDPTQENYYLIEVFKEGTQVEWNSSDTVRFKERIELTSRDPNVVYGFKGYSGFSGGVPMLSDAAFNGKNYKISFSSYDYNFNQRVKDKMTAYLYSITNERFLYLQSLKSFYDGDGNPFAEPVTVTGNIENGLGSFGLQTVDSLVIRF